MKYRVRYYKMDKHYNHGLSEIEVESESFLDAMVQAYEHINKIILRSSKWIAGGIIGMYEVK